MSARERFPVMAHWAYDHSTDGAGLRDEIDRALNLVDALAALVTDMAHALADTSAER